MMKSGGGSIAFCSSAIAHRGFANHDALAAAKGAVSGVLLTTILLCLEHILRLCLLQGEKPSLGHDAPLPIYYSLT